MASQVRVCEVFLVSAFNLVSRDTLEQIDVARLLINKYPSVSRKYLGAPVLFRPYLDIRRPFVWR